MRELFRHRDFRLLLAGQTLAMFGDWTLLLVFGIWAKTLTGSNAIAGLTVFAMVAPGLLAPFAGVVVDRLPRRVVMIGLNLVSAAVVSTLWFVEDRDQLWMLFAVAVWYGFSSVMFNAAISGLVQAMLPMDLVGPANGLLATVRQGLRLIGPLAGAGLFAVAGGRWVATLDAITLVLAAVVLMFLRHREVRAPRSVVPFSVELTAGLLHLWRSPLLRRLSLTTVIFSVAIGMVEPTVYALVGDGLHRPPEFVGVLVSVQGAGAIIGGIVVSGAIRRVSEPSLIVVGLLVVAAGAGLCAIPALPAALLGFGLVGVGIPTLGVAIATLLQRCTPNAVMGRVAAGYDMIGTVPTTASIAVGADAGRRVALSGDPRPDRRRRCGRRAVHAPRPPHAHRDRRARRHVPGCACTVAMPARIKTPPTAWMGVGIWPSSRAAKITARITSDNATNEAIELPRRRTASIPVTYASAADTRARATIGTHHGIVGAAIVTGAAATARGTMPITPASTSTTAPTPVPTVVSSRAGDDEELLSDRTK